MPESKTTQSSSEKINGDQSALIDQLQARQKQLEQENQTLRDHFEYAPTGYLTMDSAGKIHSANRALCTLLGVERSQLVGKRLQEFVALHSRDELSLHNQTVFSGVEEAKQSCEIEIEHSGGELQTVFMESVAYQTESGPLCRATLTDISTRKAAEDELGASERFIRRVLDNLFTFAGVMTPDGTLIEANRAPLEAAGLSLDDVLGKKFWDCYWWNYSPEVSGKLKDACEQAVQGKLMRFDIDVMMAEGRIMPIDFQISPLRNKHGEITYLIPSGVDITERKKAEDELREINQLLEQQGVQRTAELAASQLRFQMAQQCSRIGSWDWDIENETLVWDEAMYHLLELDLGTFIELETFFLSLHPDDAPKVDQHLKEVFSTEGTAFEMDFRIIRPDGEVRWWAGRGEVMRNDDGKPVRMLGVNFDVTNKKRYEVELEQLVEARTAELKAAQSELFKTERLAILGQLAGGVAHEIRTPLSVIRNAVHYLELTKDEGDEEMTNLIGEVKRAIDSSDNIIFEMLDYVREPSHEFTNFDIALAIDDALRLVDIPDNIRLKRYSNADDVEVRGNQDQITRIFTNLIQNSVQAMGDKEGSVLEIRTSLQEDDDELCIEFRDNGPGIPAKRQRKIFDPLFSTKVKGIGLGLPVSRRYARLNGGRLEVSSEVGEGTVFRLIVGLETGNAEA